MLRASAGYSGCTLCISAAAITPSLRCSSDLCSGGSGFLISSGLPPGSAPGIHGPGPAGPPVPPSPIPGAEWPLDTFASLNGRDGVGAAGFAQKRHGTGLSVVVICGCPRGGAGFSAAPPPP